MGRQAHKLTPQMLGLLLRAPDEWTAMRNVSASNRLLAALQKRGYVVVSLRGETYATRWHWHRTREGRAAVVRELSRLEGKKR